MNERRQDFELLQRFTREGEQSAFADVVRRHLNLVYGTALRKVELPEAAQEVAQNVFAALARKAWQFGPDDSLPAWLHKSALFESNTWLRQELRRRRREEAAAELGTTMNTPEHLPAFAALVPLLDEALLSLREKDRTALLLRFYESHSLRDVGAAVGVNEDAARKRVQSALEKLSEFFRRRGFKTATVAAIAAALQHTAATTSAAVASAVVSSVLQAAPPALASLSLLLARLASLSRVQMAAVCVAVAAVPVGWQLNEGRVAGETLKQIEAQLVTGQREAASVQAQVERLQVNAARLEQSVAQANDAAARAAADAQAFADWKQKIRGPLLAADYRWDDNSPFVRIPKAVLPSLIRESAAEPFSPPGVVNSFASELMGMTPEEQQAFEAFLKKHFADVEERVTAGILETNLPTGGDVVARRSFALQPLSDEEMKPRRDQMLAEVRSVIGEERWPLIDTRPPEAGPRVPFTTRGRNLLMRSGESVTIELKTDQKGELKVMSTFSGGSASTGPYSEGVVGYSPTELSWFLPERNPNRPSNADQLLRSFLSTSTSTLRQRVFAWLQEQAIAQQSKKENP